LGVTGAAVAGGAHGDLSEVERSLERLFRLAMGRKTLSRQTDVVGASVTRTGYAVLRTLADESPLTMGELAARAHMDPAVAARQVAALHREGLVDRSAHSGDGRIRFIEPTASGLETYSRIVEMRETYMSRVLTDWSASDRRDLVRLVDRLVADLKRQPFTSDKESR